jgi:hypothetical protein
VQITDVVAADGSSSSAHVSAYRPNACGRRRENAQPCDRVRAVVEKRPTGEFGVEPRPAATLVEGAQPGQGTGLDDVAVAVLVLEGQSRLGYQRTQVDDPGDRSARGHQRNRVACQ